MNFNLEKFIGKDILSDSAIFKEIHAIKAENDPLLMKLNLKYREKQEIHQILAKVTGKEIDTSVEISLPFYSDFGRNIILGKNIYINKNVTFVDLGGITIEDDVLIGPSVRIITVNHIVDPKQRRGLNVQPVKIEKNAWIGSNVTILPGVTIGRNSIIAADATVTKDIPENVIAMGSPAVVVKQIKEE